MYVGRSISFCHTEHTNEFSIPEANHQKRQKKLR
jgi:hypothetical protein